MNEVNQKQIKFDIVGAAVFLSLCVLCAFALVPHFAVLNGQRTQLLAAPLDFRPAQVLIIHIVIIGVLKTLVKLLALFGTSKKKSFACFCASLVLSVAGLVFFTVLYPQVWSFLFDVAFHEKDALIAGAYFVFLLPMLFTAAIIWDIFREVRAYPNKVLNVNKIKDIETRLFLSNAYQSKASNPAFSTQLAVVFAILTLLSLVGLTFPHGITYTQATQELGTVQRDVFFFLFRRDYIFMALQATFAIAFFVNHLLCIGLLKTQTQNFTRFLPFARFAFAFTYILVFALEFPLSWQLGQFYNEVTSFTPTAAYLLHFVSPIVLLAAVFLDTILSTGKTKSYRNAERPLSAAHIRFRFLTLLHGIGYGLSAVFAALAFAFPFFIYRNADDEFIKVFLYGELNKAYYPPFLPEGGANALATIHSTVAAVIAICAFSLFVFGISRIIKRPTLNLSTLVPFFTKVATAVIFSILFAIISSDLGVANIMFLHGVDNEGAFSRGLSWYAASAASLTLLITLWTDVAASLFMLLRNRIILKQRMAQRKVMKLENKKERVSAKGNENGAKQQLAQRMAELEAEIALIRKKLEQVDGQDESSLQSSEHPEADES